MHILELTKKKNESNEGRQLSMVPVSASITNNVNFHGRQLSMVVNLAWCQTNPKESINISTSFYLILFVDKI
jgi:ABC-type polysaccharide/polyol phosphate export permease